MMQVGTQALSPNSEILLQVLSLIDLGVIGYRPSEHVLLFCNQKSKDLLATEISSNLVSTLFCAPPSSPPKSLSSLMIGDSIQVGDRHIGFTLYDLPDESVWIILRDISERLHLQRSAEGASIATNLGHAFAGIVHELGNPVNSVKMAATVLYHHPEAFSTEQRQEYIGEILSETQRMQDILRVMQTFLGFDSLRLVTLDLVAECQSFVSRVRGTIPPEIDVQVLCANRAPAFASLDPGALRQVLANLFSNAIRVVQSSKAPQISFDAWAGDRFAHLRVTDNGKGLSKEQQNRLFLPFYSTHPGGMGMGLTIVKKLVSGMGGAIEVFSVLGLGATFELRFPLVEPTQAKQIG